MASCEPTLDDLLAEPIVKLLMARDGVDEAELRLLMRTTQISSGWTPDSAASRSASRDAAASHI